MDIKVIIENLVEEIKTNSDLKADFEKEPVKVIEKIAKVDLPDELIEKVVDGIKAKIALDKADDVMDSVADIASSLKKLF